MKDEILRNLKLICATKLTNAKKENNTKNIEIYTLILDILNIKDSFDKIDMEVGINIIYDLVEDLEKAKQLYLSIIS